LDLLRFDLALGDDANMVSPTLEFTQATTTPKASAGSKSFSTAMKLFVND